MKLAVLSEEPIEGIYTITWEEFLNLDELVFLVSPFMYRAFLNHIE